MLGPTLKGIEQDILSCWTTTVKVILVSIVQQWYDNAHVLKTQTGDQTATDQ